MDICFLEYIPVESSSRESILTKSQKELSTTETPGITGEREVVGLGIFPGERSFFHKNEWNDQE